MKSSAFLVRGLNMGMSASAPKQTFVASLFHSSEHSNLVNFMLD